MGQFSIGIQTFFGLFFCRDNFQNSQHSIQPKKKTHHVRLTTSKEKETKEGEEGEKDNKRNFNQLYKI